MRINLNNGASVTLPRERNIIHDRKHAHASRNHNGPVHHLGRGVDLRGPEAEEDDEQQVADSHSIISNAQRSLEPPRAPCQTAVVRLAVVVGGLVEDGELGVWAVEVAAHAAPEEEADCEEVGYVEAFEDEGDGAVKRGAVADVDEGEKGSADGDDQDRDHRDGRAFVDLQSVREEGFLWKHCLLTMLRAREKGKPLSRANDQVIREAAARQPIALQNSRTMMMHTMMVAPVSEPTALWKIRMKGDRDDSSTRSSSILVALKSTARSSPTASVPLMPRLMSMERGTSVLAFLTSSDI